MAASYPGAVKTFTTKAAGGAILAAHINDLQNEVVAVETQLGTNAGAWIGYTTTYTGFSVDPGASPRYLKIGKICYIDIYMYTPGTSNAVTFTLTAPFNATYTTYFSVPFYTDNGLLNIGKGLGSISSGSNVITLYTSDGANSWTASNGKRAMISMFYEVA